MVRRKTAEKLDAEKVAEIKRLLNDGVQNVVLANKYQVSKQLICDIKKGRAWPEVEALE